MVGSGADVTLSWSYFSDYSPFASFAKGLPVDPNGNGTQWRAPVGTDMFLSLGTFSTIRSQSNCYRIGDDYNFDPYKLSHLPYLPIWALRLAGAKNFHVSAPGHCDIPSRVGGSCRRNSGCDYGVQLEGRHFCAFVSDQQLPEIYGVNDHPRLQSSAEGGSHAEDTRNIERFVRQ